MKKRRFGMYSLAVGAFAMAITGCGGNKQESTENTAGAGGSAHQQARRWTPPRLVK